jgi:hypothetical protein
MPKIELLPIEAAMLEFKVQQQVDFFDIFLDEPTRDILVYRGDYHHSGNLGITDLNPENLVNVDGIIIDGNLSVTGTISNYIHRVKARKDCGIELLVTGSMTLHNLISTNATIYVRQNLTAETIYLFYDNWDECSNARSHLRAIFHYQRNRHRAGIVNRLRHRQSPWWFDRGGE